MSDMRQNLSEPLMALEAECDEKTAAIVTDFNRPKVVFNGKFYSAQMTGVHRVAEELLQALELLLAEHPLKSSFQSEILLPSNVQKQPVFARIKAQPPGRLPWIWWEQLELPWRARSELLVNLCNLGPLADRGGITMIHDAQIYLSPESYSAAFVAWYKLALPTLGRNASYILTVSNYSKQQLVHFKIAPAEKIRVIHNGVDHVLRSTADFEILRKHALAPHKYILALANTQAHKNISILFRAVEALADNQIKLVLMGGASKADFEAIGSTPPPSVVFTGRITDGEMRGLMERALCFACPSLTEGFGLPPLEAMLVGCPSVIAPRGALPEVCSDVALQADASDANAWAAQFHRLDSEPEFRAGLVAPSVAHAAQFTWKKSAQRLLEVIRDRHTQLTA
jgi:glycosyltransferase involved in cell wall biosynthesis